jgi:SAM-dependent methyltransferase
MARPLDPRSMNKEGNRELWDRKYEKGLPSLTKPDPFFVSAYKKHVDQSFRPPRRALDLAAGLGRHALWLTERAWDVTAVDVSEVAIRKLGQAAGQLNVKINVFAIDAGEYDFEPERFDLIVLFYHLDRNLFPDIVSALKPGGLFICKMAVHWGAEIALEESNLKPLEKNELVSLVPGLHAIDHRERPVRGRGVVEFVGKKPESPVSPQPES